MKEFGKALENRRNEFRRVRADLLARLTESATKLPVEADSCRNKLEALRRAEESFAELAEKIHQLDETRWDGKNYSADLAGAMKTVENARLEFTRISAGLTEIPAAGQPRGGNMMPEFKSITLGQWMKTGFGLSLPLIIAIILAALITAAGFVLAIRW